MNRPVTIPRWVAGAVVLWICAITAATGVGFRRTENNIDAIEGEGLARREASCEAGDEVRQIIREVTRDGDLEVGESIIEVAGAGDEPPAPEVIAQFRDILGRRLTANVNQLPGRRWDESSQECVDVELASPTTTVP